MADEKAPSERRLHERLGVIVPVEIRVLDEPGGKMMAGPMHALVTDVSTGGLRVELLGPAAVPFAQGRLTTAHLAITFLLGSLHDMGPLPCAIRWAKPLPDGHCIGLELTGAPIAERVLRALSAASIPAMAKRSAIRVAAVAGVFLLIAGMGALVWDGQTAQEALRTQLTQLAANAQQAEGKVATLERSAREAQVELGRLRQEVVACSREDQVPETEQMEPGNNDEPEREKEAADEAP